MSKSMWCYVVRFPRPIQKFIQYVCGKFGHIVGDTGYSGGNVIHCYCKRCNFYFKVPLIEMPNKYYLKDIFEAGEECEDWKPD